MELEYKYSIGAGDGILMLGFKFSENILGFSSEAWIQIQQGSWGKLDKLPWHEGLTRVLRCAA